MINLMICLKLYPIFYLVRPAAVSICHPVMTTDRLTGEEEPGDCHS